MSEPIEWSRLDASGFRVTVKRSVRRVAWFLVAIGMLVAVCGAKSSLVPLTLVGGLYLCVGGWNLRRTSVHGALLDAIALFGAGMFTCLSWKLIDGAETHMAKALFGGGMQILWGVRRIRLWAAARDASDDPAAIRALERVVAELSKRTSRDETVSEFTTGRFGQTRNRLGLYTEGVVGLLEGGAVRLEKRADIWIEARGTDVRAETIKVSVRMSDYEMTATMDAKHLERFERWKLGMAPAQSVAA